MVITIQAVSQLRCRILGIIALILFSLPPVTVEATSQHCGRPVAKQTRHGRIARLRARPGAVLRPTKAQLLILASLTTLAFVVTRPGPGPQGVATDTARSAPELSPGGDRSRGQAGAPVRPAERSIELGLLVAGERLIPEGDKRRLGSGLTPVELEKRLLQASDFQYSYAARMPGNWRPVLHLDVFTLVEPGRRDAGTSTLRTALQQTSVKDLQLWLPDLLAVNSKHPLATAENLQLDASRTPVALRPGQVLLDPAAPAVRAHVLDRVRDSARLAREVNQGGGRVVGLTLTAPGYLPGAVHGAALRSLPRTPPPPTSDPVWMEHINGTLSALWRDVAQVARSEAPGLRISVLRVPHQGRLDGLNRPPQGLQLVTAVLRSDKDKAADVVKVVGKQPGGSGVLLKYAQEEVASVLSALHEKTKVDTVLLLPQPPAGQPLRL